jgi:hypothetical protein
MSKKGDVGVGASKHGESNKSYIYGRHGATSLAVAKFNLWHYSSRLMPSHTSATVDMASVKDAQGKSMALAPCGVRVGLQGTTRSIYIV